MTRKVLPLVLCLVLLFTCIPVKTSYATSNDLPSVNQVLDKLSKVVNKIATSESKKVNIWYNRILMAARGEEDPELKFVWTAEKVVEQLRADMQVAGEDKVKEYLPEEVSYEEADRLVELFKLMDIFTENERVEIIQEMSNGQVPELLKAEEDLLNRIRRDCPGLEEDLKSINKNFNLEVYTYALLKLQPKLTEPMLSEDADGKLTINIPPSINGVKITEVVDAGLQGLDAYGYNYTSIEQLSDDFIKAFNERLTPIRQEKVKDILFQYGLFKSNVPDEVEIDPGDVKDEKDIDGKSQVSVAIKAAKVDNLGKSAPITATIPMTTTIAKELGLSASDKITIKLPELNVGKGKELKLIIKKAPETTNGKVALAIEIGAEGIGHIDNVTLTLPIPTGIDANKVAAYHREADTWEVRTGSISGSTYVFDTNLSSVALAEKVEAPVLTTTGKSTNSVSLSWSSSVTGAEYAVYKNGSFVAKTTNKAYAVTGLSSSTTYKFKVRAIDKGFESVDSNEVTVTTNSTSSGGSSGGGGSSYSGTTVKANQSAKITRKYAIVEISANAFGKDMKVKIDTVYNADKLAMPEHAKLVSNVFEITKDKEGNFKKAVTITLPFYKSNIDLEKYDLAIYWLDETKDEWIVLDNVKIDSKDGKVSGSVNHFTKFAVLAKEKSVTPEIVLPEKIVVPTDVVGHWAEKSVEKLIGLKAISGYPDGTFKPNNKITRAEFATVLVKAFDLKAQTGTVFADTKDHWAKDYIAIATTHGIASGYNEDTFGPNDLITREQMAIMVVKASMVSEEVSETTFDDSAEISDWAQKSVAAAAREKIVGGYPDNTFKPKANATRAEAMTIIANALK